jgi:hypothetical protein
MDILRWLARSAARIARLRPGAAKPRNIEQDRAAARRSLRTQLPPRVLRDIGLDDG